MGLFADAFKKMAAGIDDLSSLEVVTFQGSVNLAAGDSIESFEDVLSKAKANADVTVKVLASTKTRLDGDAMTFYDTGITEEQKLAHAELVDAANENRQATINFIREMINPGDIEA